MESFSWRICGRTDGGNTLQSKVSQLRQCAGRPDARGGLERQLHPRGAAGSRGCGAGGSGSPPRARRPGPRVTTARRWSGPGRGLSLFRGEVLAGRRRLGRAAPGRVSRRCGWAWSRTPWLRGSSWVPAGKWSPSCESLVEQYPLREGLWAALIKALYRAGRQADALAAYAAGAAIAGRRARRRSGHGPAGRCSSRCCSTSPDARSPARGAAASRATCRRSARRPSAGREDVTAVISAVAAHRLVTVVGPGGVGKTRLALEVARRLSRAGRGLAGAAGRCR